LGDGKKEEVAIVLPGENHNGHQDKLPLVLGQPISHGDIGNKAPPSSITTDAQSEIAELWLFRYHLTSSHDYRDVMNRVACTALVFSI
jgi:hypothetical protein